MSDDIILDLVKELQRLVAAKWLSVRGRQAAQHLVKELTKIREAAEQVQKFSANSNSKKIDTHTTR